MSGLAVIIASKGRPDDLGLWIEHVRRQTVAPAVMIWSVHGDADLPLALLAALPAAERPLVVRGPAGLPHQRNAALDVLPPGIEILAFFDDDYVPCDDCLEGIVAAFAADADAAGFTGTVLADGIQGAGIPVDQALSLVAGHRPVARARLRRVGSLYGCNMALRRSALGTERFDENLPLYGWQEDVDLTARLAPLYATDRFAGVHRGAKGGRVSGVRFGYSQVANILYLRRKGTMPFGKGWLLMARNIVANHVKMLRPEPWVDRRGRALGNWLAFADLVRGRLHPMRTLDL